MNPQERSSDVGYLFRLDEPVGCRSAASYLLGDTVSGRAVVVDPQRDIDQYVADADANGLRIERVIETHLHEEVMHLIGEALGDPDDPAGAIGRLVERLGLPTRLRDCEVDEEDLDAVARMSQASPAVQANVRPVGERAMYSWLRTEIDRPSAR